MRVLPALLCALFLSPGLAGAEEKPKPAAAADAFPGGHDTPEGAACDLARAFIRRDTALFSSTCVRLYAAGTGPEEYAAFLQNVTASMKQEAAKPEPSQGGPKSIEKVFTARHLSMDGPGSYGYAVFNFQDVMFVDVGVILQNGEQALNRTLVIKDKDGKWYVHPMPSVSPLLSDGLNDEADSVTLWRAKAAGLTRKERDRQIAELEAEVKRLNQRIEELKREAKR